MKIGELFEAAGLEPNGPKCWKDKVDGSYPGVYVIVAKQKSRDCPLCPIKTAQFQKIELEFERVLWVPNKEIIYIGQTSKQKLTKRIDQFYRHQYGRRSPHHGGQAVHLLNCELEVYWSPADHPKKAEAQMLFAFMRQSGRLPYANRDLPLTKWLVQN
jgi:hypothetical protein